MHSRLVLFGFLAACTDALTTTSVESAGTPAELPFLCGQTIGVSQTHNGTTSHQVDATRFGVDFTLGGVADRGLPIVVQEDGIVTVVRTGCPDSLDAACHGGWGNYVITCADLAGSIGSSCWRYAHLREAFVQPLEQVAAGTVLGTLGSSGRSDGPHLHNDYVASARVEMDASASSSYQLSRNASVHDAAHALAWLDASDAMRTGVPTVCGDTCMRSSNDAMFLPHASLGFPATGWRGYGWVASYQACLDGDGDSDPTCANESNYRTNAFARRFTGGTFGNAAVVYDALGGARSPVVVRSGFLSDATNGWLAKRGQLGMPLADEHETWFGAQQEFQFGKLRWLRAHNRVYVHPYPLVLADGRSIGPGVFGADNTHASVYWHRGLSYLVVEAWRRAGGDTWLGEPRSAVGPLAGTRLLAQKFHGEQIGESAVILDPAAWARYWNHTTETPRLAQLPPDLMRAHVVRTGFWQWYATHNGAHVLKAPLGDEYATAPDRARQDFACGWLEWDGVHVVPHLDTSSTYCNVTVPADPDEVPGAGGTDGGAGTGGGLTPMTIHCTSSPDRLRVVITGPIQQGVFTPLVETGTLLEYGSDSDGWSPYTSGKARVTWTADFDASLRPLAYAIDLPPSTQNINFFLFEPSSNSVSWFDLDRWSIAGSCSRVGGGLRHVVPQAGSIHCAGTTVTIDGTIANGIFGGAPPAPAWLEYGSHQDGWTPYTDGKPRAAYDATKTTHTLTLSAQVDFFNFFLARDGGSPVWFDLDRWSIDGTCTRDGGGIRRVASVGLLRITCEELGPDLRIHIDGPIADGLVGPLPSGSPIYLEYGSNTDGWTPYISGKPQLTYHASFTHYELIVGANVQGMNFFLYAPGTGQVSWFRLDAWTVGGACARNPGQDIYH